MYKWIFFVLLLVAFVGGMTMVFVQSGKHAAEIAPSPSAAVSDMPLDADAALVVFKANCVACHGVNLEGGVGPNLTKIGGTMTQVQIETQINNGGGVMPGFKTTIKPADVANLAKWLETKK